jgi:hypothetical protein
MSLWLQDGKRQQPPRQQQQRQHQRTFRKAASTPSSTRQDDSSTPDIPQQEMQQLQSLLRKVYRWRGWQGGAYHITQVRWLVDFIIVAAMALGTPEAVCGC